MPVPANLPSDYVADGEQKVALYKKIANSQTREKLEEVRAELKDRFGRLPDESENLLRLVELKQLARDLTIPAIRAKNGKLTIILPFFGELSLNRRHKLWVQSGWKAKYENSTLVFEGLYGVAAGKPQYPPTEVLLDKVQAILETLKNWKKEDTANQP